jgi:hypothetical protein
MARSYHRTWRVWLGMIVDALVSYPIRKYNQQLTRYPPANLCHAVNKTGFCNGPLHVKSLSSVILSPVSCFCPGSARGRHLMGSDEDRPTNLGTRSHLASCSALSGLTGSIVPATGPAPGDRCLVVTRTRDFSSTMLPRQPCRL